MDKAWAYVLLWCGCLGEVDGAAHRPRHLSELMLIVSLLRPVYLGICVDVRSEPLKSALCRAPVGPWDGPVSHHHPRQCRPKFLCSSPRPAHDGAPMDKGRPLLATAVRPGVSDVQHEREETQ
jgi:hypothetical protein